MVFAVAIVVVSFFSKSCQMQIQFSVHQCHEQLNICHISIGPDPLTWLSGNNQGNPGERPWVISLPRAPMKMLLARLTQPCPRQVALLVATLPACLAGLGASMLLGSSTLMLPSAISSQGTTLSRVLGS